VHRELSGGDEEFFALIVCPKCVGPLSRNENPVGLVCEACNLFYPIEDGLPHLLLDEAQRWPLSDSPSP
jgi:uncharacterized protein